MPDRPVARQTADNAMENYQKALAANPTSVEAQSNLAWGYYGMHKYPEAIQAFQEALKLDQNWFDANYGLALSFKCADNKQQAAAAFERCAALASQVEDQVRSRMLVRLIHGHINEIRTGDWDLARELYHREV